MEELLFDRGLMTNVFKTIEKTKNIRILKSLSRKNLQKFSFDHNFISFINFIKVCVKRIPSIFKQFNDLTKHVYNAIAAFPSKHKKINNNNETKVIRKLLHLIQLNQFNQ